MIDITYNKDNQPLVDQAIIIHQSIDKITENSNFIDYENLDTEFSYPKGVVEVLANPNNTETTLYFTTDYYCGFNIWNS